jgi:hypothetical protein
MRKPFSFLLLAAVSFATFGCGTGGTVKTVDGHPVSLPNCKPSILYQGSKWAVRGSSYQGIQVGAVEWERKFRDAQPLIQVLDKQEVEHCQSLRTIVSVSTLEEVKKELAARAAASVKRDQLMAIITAQDPKALERFIEIYYMPVSNSFYEEQKEASGVAVAKTGDTDRAFKLRNIDARPASMVFAQRASPE